MSASDTFECCVIMYGLQAKGGDQLMLQAAKKYDDADDADSESDLSDDDDDDDVSHVHYV